MTVAQPDPGTGAGRRALSSTPLRWALAIAAGGAVFLVMTLASWTAGPSDTLQAMGFDPDRTSLILALTAGAASAAAGAALTGSVAASALVGASVAGVQFAPTFQSETKQALAAAGDQGRFDPGGWLLTLAALIVLSLAAGWAVATLTSVARARLLEAATRGRALATGDHPARRRRAVGSVVSVLAPFAAVAAVALAMPVLGDMLTFAPDTRMVAGAAGPSVGAVTPSAGDVTSPMPSPSTVTTSSGTPWVAWRPTGAGRLVTASFPAPWSGGTDSTATLTIYLPPGYDTSPTVRYPVVYEVPWHISGWQAYVHITAVLDGLIDGGQLPAEIVAFVSQAGGPYPDSECIDSADGKEHYEAYLVETVVPYLDATYRTIATPGARSLLGFSEGGFCSSMLLLRHPDLFHSCASFSGYYQAAIRDAETPNAWRPFGGDQTLIRSSSPIDLAALVPPDQRSQLYVALSGDPTERFFGPQLREMDAALVAAQIPAQVFATPFGHAWQAMRSQLPTVLEAIAARQAAAGVFAHAP